MASYAGSGPGAAAALVAVLMSCCRFSPKTIAASSRNTYMTGANINVDGGSDFT